jgi:cell division cycle 14
MASHSYAMRSPQSPKRRVPRPKYRPLIYTPDRLYLAAYVHAPTADTPFPYPEAPAPSPRKRAAAAAAAAAAQQASGSRKVPCYFSVDDILLYNAFHHDFGPLHIGHLYRFAIQFHDILAAKENKDRPIVFWSHADPRSMLVPRLSP